MGKELIDDNNSDKKRSEQQVVSLEVEKSDSVNKDNVWANNSGREQDKKGEKKEFVNTKEISKSNNLYNSFINKKNEIIDVSTKKEEVKDNFKDDKNIAESGNVKVRSSYTNFISNTFKKQNSEKGSDVGADLLNQNSGMFSLTSTEVGDNSEKYGNDSKNVNRSNDEDEEEKDINGRPKLLQNKLNSLKNNFNSSEENHSGKINSESHSRKSDFSAEKQSSAQGSPSNSTVAKKGTFLSNFSPFLFPCLLSFQMLAIYFMKSNFKMNNFTIFYDFEIFVGVFSRMVKGLSKIRKSSTESPKNGGKESENENDNSSERNSGKETRG